MTHNTRVRTDVTAWSSTTAAVTPAELDKLDGYAFQSINGDQGGVWAPITVLEIGGQGLKVSGPLLTTGNVNFSTGFAANGASFVNDTLLVDQLVVFDPSEFEALCEFFGDVHAFEAMTVEGPLDCLDTVTFNDTAEFNHNVTFHSLSAVTMNHTLTVLGDADFEGDITFDGVLDCWDDVNIHSGATLRVLGTSDFSGDVTMNGDLDCWGDVTIHSGGTFQTLGPCVFGDSGTDPISVNGTMTLFQYLKYSGSGRVPCRSAIGSNVSQPFSVTDGNVIYVPTLTTARNYSVTDAGTNGDEILFANASTSHALVIELPDGSLNNITAVDSLTPGWCRIVRVSGSWRFVQRFSA